MAIAHQSLFVAERFDQCLAEHDADIFHGVVKIDLRVALGAHLELEKRVLAEQRQHVIKKRDARLHARAAMTVDGQLDQNVGLAGDPMDLRVPHLAHFFSSSKRIETERPWASSCSTAQNDSMCLRTR